LLTPARTARELTTPNGAASRSEHLLIRIIGHSHNGPLDLVRRAARWHAPTSGHRGKAAQKMS
jgi:hypothetical protein